MSNLRSETNAPSILLVEDDGLLRMTIADFLRDRGYPVVEATSGDEAISTLETVGDVDVVFSDVHMPGNVDGFGLARWVSRHRPEVPVLLTSGVYTEDGVVPKPYDVADVEERIKRLLNTQPLSR
ncbi:response regulator [Reyranella sp. CPCC 100927]|uniref:response regulator n=1 Tax=Reyranella sp. CPCC 100927 TaxID=2599616 RepID=UPI0011B63A9D|nr:response regulator [Reyranella sp. CPCC 100927]TWS97334.1 response regulator [Reyranella sp. CPCC 100927]